MNQFVEQNDDPILSRLNEAQKEAVTAPFNKDALVFACAGTGKTTTLVGRVAWLLRNQVSPFSLFVVTFTNKAARELRARIESLLNQSITGMWVGTFHGLAHRLLRAHWQSAGLPEMFQIMDSDESIPIAPPFIKIDVIG